MRESEILDKALTPIVDLRDWERGHRLAQLRAISKYNFTIAFENSILEVRVSRHSMACCSQCEGKIVE